MNYHEYCYWLGCRVPYYGWATEFTIFQKDGWWVMRVNVEPLSSSIVECVYDPWHKWFDEVIPVPIPPPNWNSPKIKIQENEAVVSTPPNRIYHICVNSSNPACLACLPACLNRMWGIPGPHFVCTEKWRGDKYQLNSSSCWVKEKN